MKTAKYFIEVEMLENPMIHRMQINKNEFEGHLNLLMKTCETTADDETPVELFRDEIHEFATYTHRTVIFHCGCCATYLNSYVCKEGYKFEK